MGVGRKGPWRWPSGWFDGEAWRRVLALAKAQGIDLERELQREQDTIGRGRRLAELLAPLDVMQSAAISHGTDPANLENHKSAHRLRAELSHRRLAMIGLKSGEVVEHGLSEKMERFLEAWYNRPRRDPAGNILPGEMILTTPPMTSASATASEIAHAAGVRAMARVNPG